MPRAGFVVTEGEVVRVAGRVACVVLANGHRLYARWRRQSQARPPLAPGCRVRLEVPVTDPAQGFVLERLGDL